MKGDCLRQKVNTLISKCNKIQHKNTNLKSQILHQLNSVSPKKVKLEKLKDKLRTQTEKVENDRETLEMLQILISKHKNRLNKLFCELENQKFPEHPGQKDLLGEVEKLRKKRIREASWVLENNPYFPDYSISLLFSKEKVISFSQIVQEESGTKSIDRPNFIITFKTGRASLLSQEHQDAILHSLNSVCMFQCYVSYILNSELPFPLEFKTKYFQVEDVSGNKHPLDLESLESGLVFLYLNMYYLQQQAGVETSKLRGLFDVPAFAQSPFLGRWFSLPSLPVENQKKYSSSDEEWEILED